MQTVLISIKPKYCELIANGKKIIEVRKTKPRLETPFKCFIYCTKPTKYTKGYADDDLFRHVDGEIECGFSYQLAGEEGSTKDNILSGKVIGEFICDKIDEYPYSLTTFKVTPYEELAKTCLSIAEINDYSNGKTAYLWHISNLKIYDKPKELEEFYRPIKYDSRGPICGTKHEMMDLDEWDCEAVFGVELGDDGGCLFEKCPRLKAFRQIKKPPQSWCYVEV